MAIDNTFGAMFIGITVAAVLYGLTFIQTWYYFTHYPSDPRWIKILVAAVFILDTIHQALVSHMIYTYLITYFGQWDRLEQLVWSLVVEVYFNGATTFLVQCFMAWRIYKLSHGNWWFVSSVMTLVIGELIVTMVYCIKGVSFTTFTELITIKPISMSINAFSAVADVYIAILLCYLLQTSRTGFRKSDSMISKLIVFSINTGLLTSIDALISLITYSVFGHALIYISFYYCIGRLYCNSLLATLNARREMRGDPNNEEETGMSVTLQSHSLQKMGPNMLGRTSGLPTNNISIKIDTTKEYVRDEFALSSAEVKKSLEAVAI